MSWPPARTFVAIALAVAVGLAAAVSPFASSSPDGLETVAAEKRFADRGAAHAAQRRTPIAGYAFPGIADERLATGMAGFLGVLIVFGAGYGVARLLRRRRGVPPPPTASGGPAS